MLPTAPLSALQHPAPSFPQPGLSRAASARGGGATLALLYVPTIKKYGDIFIYSMIYARATEEEEDGCILPSVG